MASLVGRITIWKISPRSAGAQDEEYAVEHLTPITPALLLPILPPPHAHAGKDVSDRIEVTSLAWFLPEAAKPRPNDLGFHRYSMLP